MQIFKLRYIQSVLLAVIVYFVGKALINQLSMIKPSDLNISIELVLLSLLFEFAARVLVVVGYYRLLQYFSTPLSLNISVAICWVSFMGKYIPGKIALIGSVIYFLKQYKIPTTIAGMVPVLNTMITIFVALIFSMPLLISKENQVVYPFFYIILLLIIGGFFFLRPINFFAVSNMIFNRLGIPETRLEFTPSQIATYLLIVGIQCVLAGISTWLISKSVFLALEISSLPKVISITAFSGTMGLLAFFSPAGIGVRDGFFYISLSGITGLESAAVITILLRLIHTIVDVGSAVTGFIYLEMDKKRNFQKRENDE